MGVSEKLAPKALSVSATVLGVAVCGWLFFRGETNPRLYTSHMAINNHSGYGRTFACRECHVPGQGFFLTPTCITSSCHGELAPGRTQEEKIADMMAYWKDLGQSHKTDRTALAYLTTHANYRIDECSSCHGEHVPRPAPDAAAGHANVDPALYRSLLDADS